MKFMGLAVRRMTVLSIAAVLAIGAVTPNAGAEHVVVQAVDSNQGGEMSSDVHAVTLRRFYEECLNRGRLDLLPELVSADVVNHGYAGEQKGLAAFEQGIRGTLAMFPNPHFTVDAIVSNGDEAALRWSLVATHTTPIAGVAPTGKRLTQHGIVFYRFEGGKIAEVWLQVDRLGILQQLGVVIPGLPGPAAIPAR